jgi:hypothetical protein
MLENSYMDGQEEQLKREKKNRVIFIERLTSEEIK